MRVSVPVLCLLSALCVSDVAHAQSVSVKPAAPAKPPTAAVETSAADPSGVSEAEKASARSHFKLGVDFYREGNFRAALIEFQRAYADSPHYKLLYNLGQASLELQEYASAIDYLTDYLQEGGTEITAERGAEVEQTILYLESRISYVRILSNEPGAELYVDDTSVGKSPLERSVRVGAGRHKFSAVREGQPPVERKIDVAAGDQSEVHLDFQKQAAVAPLAVAPISPLEYEEPSASSNTAAIVMAVTTGALLAGAVTMTVVTGVAQQSYQEELLVQTTRGRLNDLQSSAETKAIVTDILWGATAVSAVVTTVLFVTSSGESNGVARAGLIRAGRKSHGGVAVHAGLGSLALTGKF